MNIKRKAVLLTIALWALAGCSLFKKALPPYPQGPVFPMVKKAETPFNGDIIQSVKKLDSVLYFCTQPDLIYAYSMEKRQFLWRKKAAEVLISSPILGGKSLYVLGETGTLFRFSYEGRELWRRKLSSPSTGGVYELNDLVIIGLESEGLTALDIFTSEARWTFSLSGRIGSNITGWKDNILFGSDEGVVYALNTEGQPVSQYQADGPVGPNLKVDEDRLYFGTEKRIFYALDLRKFKKKWARILGGPVRVPSEVEGKNLYVTCWDGVLYCLNKKTGNVDWWRSLPSRSQFSPIIVADRVIASAQAPRLVGFKKQDGESLGYYAADSEVRANPIWKEPEILISLFDNNTGKGSILHLEKEVTLTMTSSLETPQPMGTEINLSVTAVGFFMPKYEFYIVSGEERIILQAESTQNTYNWFPDKAGSYRVGVAVHDEREERIMEIPYTIQSPKKKNQKFL
jgi:outer membrane protein assembly factor BamB